MAGWMGVLVMAGLLSGAPVEGTPAEETPAGLLSPLAVVEPLVSHPRSFVAVALAGAGLVLLASAVTFPPRWLSNFPGPKEWNDTSWWLARGGVMALGGAVLLAGLVIYWIPERAVGALCPWVKPGGA